MTLDFEAMEKKYNGSVSQGQVRATYLLRGSWNFVTLIVTIFLWLRRDVVRRCVWLF